MSIYQLLVIAILIVGIIFAFDANLPDLNSGIDQIVEPNHWTEIHRTAKSSKGTQSLPVPSPSVTGSRSPDSKSYNPMPN